MSKRRSLTLLGLGIGIGGIVSTAYFKRKYRHSFNQMPEFESVVENEELIELFTAKDHSELDIISADATIISVEKPVMFADDLYNHVKNFVIEKQKASATVLRAEFKIGSNRAKKMIEQLESDGIIGPFNGNQPREILINKKAA